MLYDVTFDKLPLWELLKQLDKFKIGIIFVNNDINMTNAWQELPFEYVESHKESLFFSDIEILSNMGKYDTTIIIYLTSKPNKIKIRFEDHMAYLVGRSMYDAVYDYLTQVDELKDQEPYKNADISHAVNPLTVFAENMENALEEVKEEIIKKKGE